MLGTPGFIVPGVLCNCRYVCYRLCPTGFHLFIIVLNLLCLCFLFFLSPVIVNLGALYGLVRFSQGVRQRKGELQQPGIAGHVEQLAKPAIAHHPLLRPIPASVHVVWCVCRFSLEGLLSSRSASSSLFFSFKYYFVLFLFLCLFLLFSSHT